MAQYSNNKNPPWSRSGGQQSNMPLGGPNQMQQAVLNSNITGSGLQNSQLLSYPQQQMFQGQMSGFQPQLYGNMNNMGNVSYPTRALNSAAFQGASGGGSGVSPSVPSAQSATAAPPKPGQSQQRVFTGTITKLQDNFGFVDDNVFFQTSCCVKGSTPQVNDRVLVEAVYNPTMPFKWNATRIQVLNLRNPNQPAVPNQPPQQRGYNAVPPPSEKMDMDMGGGREGSRFNQSRFSAPRMNPDMNKNRRNMNQNNKNRNRPLDRQDSPDRKRPRREKSRERKVSPAKSRKSKSKSPAKKRRRVTARYNISIPKYSLECSEVDILQLKRHFNNMYIPSDFFMTKAKWTQSFPVEKPFSLDFPCRYHLFHKDVEPLEPPVPEPSDLDYIFSAKVILLACPGLEEIYRRCIKLGSERERAGSSGSLLMEDSGAQPSRLINFLVGQRNKEPLAIGGPWSPSLDGDDPESDPGVLIKTAIRTCKYLTGIDLSNCTHWYRFLELYYHRGETTYKGKAVPARVETVVLFIPDVWSCVPTRPEWDQLQQSYHSQMMRKLTKEKEPEQEKVEEEPVIEETEEKESDEPKRQPTHYSELDPKTMKVSDLRDELEVRNLSPKGLKSQLIARLTKALKTEEDEEDRKKKAADQAASSASASAEAAEEKEDESSEPKKEEEIKVDAKEKALLEKRCKLPDNPQIVVHANRAAKSGKFDCAIVSLYNLLNYMPSDNKEHSFEMFLFAEMFNNMLMRDFGFHIYRAIHVAPEKPKEEKKDDKDKDKKKDGKAKEKEKDEKDDKEKDVKSKPEKEEEDMEEDDDTKSETSKRDDEKKDKVKVVTADPYLLLSFIYFDKGRSGYIQEKDLEDLLFCLNLSLSRSQVTKLVQKVVGKDSLHYRKLTDKTEKEVEESKQDIQDVKVILSSSNREMLPMFDEDKKSGENLEQMESGFVMHNGTLVDVGKLLKQLDRNESTRFSTEKLYTKLLKEHGEVKQDLQNSLKNIKELSAELNYVKKNLNASNSDLDLIDAKMTRYLKVFHHIRDTVDPIIKESIAEMQDEEVPQKQENPSKELQSQDKIKEETSVEKNIKQELDIEEEGKDSSKATVQEHPKEVKNEEMEQDEAEEQIDDSNADVQTDEKNEDVQTDENKTDALSSRKKADAETKQKKSDVINLDDDASEEIDDSNDQQDQEEKETVDDEESETVKEEVTTPRRTQRGSKTPKKVQSAKKK